MSARRTVRLTPIGIWWSRTARRRGRVIVRWLILASWTSWTAAAGPGRHETRPCPLRHNPSQAAQDRRGHPGFGSSDLDFDGKQFPASGPVRRRFASVGEPAVAVLSCRQLGPSNCPREWGKGGDACRPTAERTITAHNARACRDVAFPRAMRRAVRNAG